MVYIYYCYDAYCSWCYGFSPVMKKIAETYQHQIGFEVLSGGMIVPETPMPFAPLATYIQTSYKEVEELTGIKFGQDFLWHVNYPEETDWYPDSTLPAIALCLFKEYHPNKAITIAGDLQYALNFEGRDLTDPEAYRHLMERYHIPADEFYAGLKSEEYKDKAHSEFALCKQLQVKAYPSVLMQVTDSMFYLLAQGYTSFDALQMRIQKVLKEIA